MTPKAWKGVAAAEGAAASQVAERKEQRGSGTPGKFIEMTFGDGRLPVASRLTLRCTKAVDCVAWSSVAGQLHSLSALFNKLGNEPRPSRLVAGSNPGPVVAMKVFVEINAVAPVWIALKFFEPAINGTPAFC